VLGCGSNGLSPKRASLPCSARSLNEFHEATETLEVPAGEEWDPVVAMPLAPDLAGLNGDPVFPVSEAAGAVMFGAYGQESPQTITHVSARTTVRRGIS